MAVSHLCLSQSSKINSWEDLKGTYSTNLVLNPNNNYENLEVSMTYDGSYLEVNFLLISNQQKKNPLLGILYSNETENKINKDILFVKADLVYLATVNGEQRTKETIGDYSRKENMRSLKITKLDNNKLALDYNIVDVFKEIFSNSYIPFLDIPVNFSDTTFELIKSKNIGEWWYFNPRKNISENNTEKSLVKFIEGNTDSYKLSSRTDFVKYLDIVNLDNIGDGRQLKISPKKNKFLSALTDSGSLFESDFNGDGFLDIGCYYTKGRDIHFLVFIKNSIGYELILNLDLSRNKEKPILTKHRVNDINMIRVDYVNDDKTDYLYYDKTNNKLDYFKG